ncbi:MAG: tRNA (adenosine(37)-N6)-threonylcarbamoyltransferase complex transferase subunit TsaD [Actinobacteria bacterium]|nr:MAG: tRNA (adenosine(37)-N6)-threonylcarbamoyltransferase complex transferase subunit TsaD [Actinomycetota bacterium]
MNDRGGESQTSGESLNRELILGVETSCDETAAAVVRGGREVLSNVVASQVDLHARFGGVVPEIASRNHLEAVNLIVDEALTDARVGLADLDAIAVTIGPGLVGALQVGLAAAKALAFATGLPLVGVNHIEGHIFANLLEHPDLMPPVVCLVVSGGHTLLLHMPEFGEYEVMGSTIDDAAGEAFDKIAKYLGLGYPGGPIIDRLAAEGNPDAIPFPRAMLHTKDFDFSLSGLKTSVINYVRKEREQGREIPLPDLAASFQAAVIDVQVFKTLLAAEQRKVTTVLLGGGVAANTALRERLRTELINRKMRLLYPSSGMCTDNAAMIASAGHFRLWRGESLSLNADAVPNLQL